MDKPLLYCLWLLGLPWLLTFLSTVYYTQKVRRIFLGVDVSGPAHALPSTIDLAEGALVDFKASDGVGLRGIFLRARGSDSEVSRPVVVFSHPVGTCGGIYTKYVDWLRDEGFHIFSFDHRGHGESQWVEGYRPRQWITRHEVNDMLGAIDHVLELPAVDASRVMLFGVSRGAGTALASAWQRPQVRAIVADSIFTNWDTLQERMRQWASIVLRSEWLGRNIPTFIYTYLGITTIMLSEMTQKVPFASVTQGLKAWYGRPLLMIHGQRDSYISVEQARLLARRHMRDPEAIMIVPGARHNDAIVVAGEAYRDRVRKLFSESMAV